MIGRGGVRGIRARADRPRQERQTITNDPAASRGVVQFGLQKILLSRSGKREVWSFSAAPRARLDFRDWP